MDKLLLVKIDLSCEVDNIFDGLFVCSQQELQKLYGKTCYFGEWFGEYDPITVKLNNKHFTIISEDKKVINAVSENGNTICGINPFCYIADLE
jgi:hypothetical protein